MIAFKTYIQCPEDIRPSGIPLDWPWVEQPCESSETVMMINAGFQVLEESAYSAYKAARQAEYNAWASSVGQVSQIILRKLAYLRSIAPTILMQLYTDNTLAGITTAQSDQMFDDYQDVLVRINEGAFPTAIYRLQHKTPSGFVTQQLIDSWITRIQAYLI